jgi:O-antigen ligase
MQMATNRSGIRWWKQPDFGEYVLALGGALVAFWLLLGLQQVSTDPLSQAFRMLPIGIVGILGLLLVRDPYQWVFFLFPYTLMLRIDPVYWILGGLVILLQLVDLSQSGSSSRLTSFDRKFTFIVLSVGLLGVFPSPDKSHALFMYFETYLLPMGFYLAIVRSPRGGEYVRGLIRHGVIAFAIIGLGSLFVKLSQPGITRPGGFFHQYPTMIGQTAAAVLPFCYARLSRAWNAGNVVLLLLVFLAMLLTNTRMAVLTTMLGLALYPELWFRLALPALMISMARTWMVELGFFHRLEQVTSGLEPSVLARFVAWKAALQLIWAHPWGGIGFSRFQHIYLSLVPIPFLRLQHAHNLLLNTCLELGIPGMLTLLGSISAFLVRAAWRLFHSLNPARWQPERKALIVACVVFLGSGAVDSVFLSASWTMLFWAWMGGVRRLELDEEMQVEPVAAPTPAVAPR